MSLKYLAKAKEADAFKTRAMHDAGVSLIRVPARQANGQEHVASYILEDEPTETEQGQASKAHGRTDR